MKRKLHISVLMMVVMISLLALPVCAETPDWWDDWYGDPGPDTSKITLKAVSGTDLFQGQQYDQKAELKIKIKCPGYTFNDNSYIDDIYFTNSNVYAYNYTVKNNVVTVGVYLNSYFTNKKDVSAKIKFRINGKTFKGIKFRIRKITMNQDSVILAQGGSKKLSVVCGKKKVGQKAKWKSSNTKVATVDQNGKVKAKKSGNAVISATIKGNKVGCVVSVGSKKKVKAVQYAKNVVKTSKYSQKKRMQKGYYDCSSLVWKAYKSKGCNFGSGSYAPTAAAQAKYMANHHKMLGSVTEKKIKSMYYQIGDVAYHIGPKNGRYRNIYHTEMLTGYYFGGFDSKGKAIVGLDSLRSGIGPGNPIARP